MARRLPPPRKRGWSGGDAPRMFARALIRRVADTGKMPEREEFMAALMTDGPNWRSWTRWAARTGMIVRSYGEIDFAPEVLAEAMGEKRRQA